MDVETSSDLDRKQCTKHGLDVEYFCKAHRLSACAKCIVQEHRTCKEICDISEDLTKTRHLLMSVIRNVSQGIDRLKQEKKDAGIKCKNTLTQIDELKRNFISQIDEGLNEYKRCAEQYEAEVKTSIDLKLQNLEQLDREVKELMERLCRYGSMMDYGSIQGCYNTGKAFESSANESIPQNSIIYDMDFAPSEICKMILENPVILGNKEAFIDSRGETKTSSEIYRRHIEMQLNDDSLQLETRRNIVKEKKLVQTCDKDKENADDLLQNLSNMIDSIKRSGNEVVLCLGKLVITENRKLKIFDIVNNKTLSETMLDYLPSTLISVGSNHIAMIFKELVTIICYEVTSCGLLRRHRRFSDTNCWTDILTIAEGKGGRHILATIKSFETSDFKHPATLTRLHNLFI